MDNSNYKMNFTTKADPFWEVFFKGKKIGIIYKTGFSGDWRWRFEHSNWSLPVWMVSENKGHSLTRRKAFEEIVHSNEKFMKEGDL